MPQTQIYQLSVGDVTTSPTHLQCFVAFLGMATECENKTALTLRCYSGNHVNIILALCCPHLS